MATLALHSVDSCEEQLHIIAYSPVQENNHIVENRWCCSRRLLPFSSAEYKRRMKIWNINHWSINLSPWHDPFCVCMWLRWISLIVCQKCVSMIQHHTDKAQLEHVTRCSWWEAQRRSFHSYPDHFLLSCFKGIRIEHVYQPARGPLRRRCSRANRARKKAAFSAAFICPSKIARSAGEDATYPASTFSSRSAICRGLGFGTWASCCGDADCAVLVLIDSSRVDWGLVWCGRQTCGLWE